MEKLADIIGQKIKRLFLVVWPPDGEEAEAGIDISIGFVSESTPSTLLILSTNNDDMWSPQLHVQNIPTGQRPFSEFSSRMALWQRQELLDLIDYEYYEITWDSSQFSEFLDKTIIGINLLSMQNDGLPFGVRLIFFDNYILSFPGVFGNRIETKYFNVNSHVPLFNSLGNTIETSIFETMA
jgi:hypothetical protein